MRRFSILALGVIGAIGLSLALAPRGTTAAEKAAPDPAALERARDQVKMLDDLYKTAVVGITATYVNQQNDTPAAAVAKKVFEAMHKKGYHTARLIDATGKPKSFDNMAESEFEKKAVKEIKGGKAYFEEIGEAKGKPVLRAATVVPAVMKQCVQCHGGIKEGEVMGAIVYELPIK
jgi:hypothetical protein